MRKALICLTVFVLIGCHSVEDNFNTASEVMGQAQANHPDMDFGMIRETPENEQLITMAAQGWSIYMSIPGYKGGGGWDYIIIHRRNNGRKP